MQTPSAKFESLDTLRGFAALSVFIFHFHTSFKDLAFTGFLSLFGSAGHVGLDIFFVLSGFLIFRSIYLHGVNKQYFVRRFLRIAPIYYFSLAIVLLFIDHSYFFSSEGWRNILSHLLFLQSFSSQTYYGINPVLWSLSVELIFYLFLPIFFLISKKKTWRILFGILIMLLICYYFRVSITDHYPNWNPTQRIIYTENFIGRLDQFAFGMLASFFTLKLNSSKLLKTFSLLILIAGIIGLIYGMRIFEEFSSAFRDTLYLQVFLHSLIGIATAFIIFGLSNSFKIISKIIGNRIFAFFGLISYSFYIWHMLIIDQLRTLSPNESLFGQEFWIITAIVTAFSALTYFMVEKSFLTKKTY